MADEKFRALLSAELESGALDNIKKQLNGLSEEPIQIGIDLDLRETQRQLNAITDTFRDLNRTMRGLHFENLFRNFNSSSASLRRIAETFGNLEDNIVGIRNALGTIDNDVGIASITQTINEMNRATENAVDQMRELIEVTRNQNFSFNLNMGAGNTTAAYGRAARQSITELRQQASAIEEAFRVATNATQGYEAVFRAAAGTNQMGRLFEIAPNIGDTTQSLRQQMDVYREYIQIQQEIARIRGIDLSGVTAGFGRSANEIIDSAERVHDGTAQIEQNLERVRGILGGGIGAEELTAQIDRVCSSLEEIRTSLNGLGENIRFDGLTASFDRLSATIENLLHNATIIRTVLGNGLGAAGSQINDVVQSTGRLYDINLDTMPSEIGNVTEAMRRLGFCDESIRSVTDSLSNMEIAIRKITIATRNTGGINLSIEGKNQYGDTVTNQRSVYEVQEEGDMFPTLIDEDRGTRLVRTFKEIDAAYSELKRSIQEMSKLQGKLIGLDARENMAEIVAINNRLHELQQRIIELYDTHGNDFSVEQIRNLDMVAVSAAESITQLKARTHDAANNDAVNQSFRELGDTIRQIGSLEGKLISLDPNKDQAQIEELRRELDALYLSYNRVFTENSHRFSTSQINQLENEFQSAAEKVAILDAKLQDVSAAKLKAQIDEINSGLDTSKYEKEVKSVEAAFKKLGVQSDAAKDAIKQLKESFETLKESQGNDEAMLAAASAYATALEKAKNIVDIDKLNPRQQLTSDIKTWLTQNGNAAADARAEVQKLLQTIEACSETDIDKHTAEWKRLKQAIDSSQDSALNLQNVITRLASQYLSFTDICNYIKMAFKAMYENVLEIDTAMTNLYKVTDETANRYDKFLSTAAKKSKELGRNMASYIEQTADWTKLGYSLDEAEQLSELSSVYANVGEVDDATAVSDIVTAMKAFNIEATNAITIIDSLNELGKILPLRNYIG